MTKNLTLAAMVLSLAVPILAQESPMADVGQGAPRETLAYIVAKPSTMMAIAGWSDGNFVWWPEQPAMPELPEGMEMPKDPSQAAMETFLPLIKEAKRVDLALIDISISGPRMYIDVTLADDAEVDLAPEWLRELAEDSEGALTISPARMHGIEMTRYSMEGSEFPIFAFVRAGHMYVCISDTAADQLASGLTRGPLEAGSLAELSRFRDWYGARKNAALEVWFNAHELRRWIERGEGVLPEDFRNLISEVDRNLELRTWTQLTLALDYDPDQKTAGVDLDIQSRRKIPLFEKAGMTPASFEPLSRWLPGNTVGLIGFQFGDVNGIIERLGDDIDSVLNMLNQQAEARREAWEQGWGEESFPEGFPEPERDGGGMRQQGPDSGPKGPFSGAIAGMDEQLSEIGTSSKELFATLSGSVIAGTLRPDGDAGYTFMEDGAKIIAIGVKDHDKLHAILVKAMAKANEEDEGMASNTPLPGFSDAWIMNGQGIIVALANDALVITVAPGDDGTALEVISSLPTRGTSGTGTQSAALRGHLSGLARSTSTMILGVDIYDAMRGSELQAIENSRQLSIYARPYSGKPVDEFVGPGFGVAVSASMTENSFSISARFNRIQIDRLFKMAGNMGGGWDPKHGYAESQLQQLFGEIHERYTNQGKPVPASVDAMVADGIHRSFFQNLSDSRFEGGDAVSWFIPPSMLDSDWYAGDPAVAAIKANAAKSFSSYTMVPNAAFSNFGAPVIVLYETEANTHGGRTVLYSTGQTGWLHDSVWEQAMALTKEGKPIPAPSPWGDFPGFPGDFPGDFPDDE
jgi:hypothetical protein